MHTIFLIYSHRFCPLMCYSGQNTEMQPPELYLDKNDKNDSKAEMTEADVREMLCFLL